jgi:hypothetical protein
VDERLPQRHLARLVVEVIEGLDLSEPEQSYRGSGLLHVARDMKLR